MRTLARLILCLLILSAVPASAQMMGGGMAGGPGGMVDRPMGQMGPMMGGPEHGRMAARPHESPLISMALAHSKELGLSPEQEQKLRDLQTGFAKEAVRKQADIRIAEIDLNAQLEQPRWDLAKVEPLVKQIAALRGDLRLARIRTLAAGRALLTPDQLEKLKQAGHQMGPPPGMGSGSGMQHGMGMGSGQGMQHGPGAPGGPGGPRPQQ
jgi:Spy/CpxP family protein refolding chaperone